MSERITKVVLAVLAINSAAIGLWAAFALLVMSRQLVLATATAWLVYGVPHLVYHLRHLSPFSGGDVVSIPVSLALGVAGALLLLLPPRPAKPVTSSVGSAGTSRHNQPNPAAGD